MKKLLNYLLIFEIIVFGVLVVYQILEKETKFDYYSNYYGVRVKELSGKNKAWYYEIYHGEKLLIKQENIPGTSGNQYFKSSKEAKKIGSLVVDKLVHKMMPNVTLKELDSCNINFKK